MAEKDTDAKKDTVETLLKRVTRVEAVLRNIIKQAEVHWNRDIDGDGLIGGKKGRVTLRLLGLVCACAMVAGLVYAGSRTIIRYDDSGGNNIFDVTTDDDGTGDVTIGGGAITVGDLTVTNSTTQSGALTVEGTLTANGAIAGDNDTDITGISNATFVAGGTVTANGGITANGDITANADITGDNDTIVSGISNLTTVAGGVFTANGTSALVGDATFTGDILANGALTGDGSTDITGVSDIEMQGQLKDIVLTLSLTNNQEISVSRNLLILNPTDAASITVTVANASASGEAIEFFNLTSTNIYILSSGNIKANSITNESSGLNGEVLIPTDGWLKLRSSGASTWHAVGFQDN